MKCLGGHMECLGGMRLQIFLTLFTRATPGTPSSERYRRICSKLRDPVVLVQLHFLQNLEPLFTPFLALFQREEPLIHVLHDQLSELVRKIMKRFLKQTVVQEKSGKALISIDVDLAENILDRQKEMEIGEPTARALKKVRAEQQKRTLMDMQNFYRTSTKYLMSRLPLDNELLKDLAVLHPLMHKEDHAVHAIRRTAKKLPQIINEDDLGRLTNEWKIYQGQNIPEEWFISGHHKNGSIIFTRVDKYWQKLFETTNTDGSARYCILPKLVKALLCIAHGNAEVERSLSENGKVLTSERNNLNDDTLNALRVTKNAIRVTGNGQACNMPITPELMKARQTAYAVYVKRMEEERVQKENEKLQCAKKALEEEEKRKCLKEMESKKRKLGERDSDIAKEQVKQEKEVQTARRLFREANERLQQAVKENSMGEMSVVSALMEVAQKKIDEASKKLEDCRKEREVVHSKRRKIMDWIQEKRK